MKGNIAAIVAGIIFFSGTFAYTQFHNVEAADVTNPTGSVQNPTGSVQNPGPGTSCTSGGGNQLVNPLKVCSITEFLLAIIEILLIFATPIIVIYIMYAGFLFVTARGAPGELEHARNALLYALIGGVIIVGARVIINIIQTTINQIR